MIERGKHYQPVAASIWFIPITSTKHSQHRPLSALDKNGESLVWISTLLDAEKLTVDFGVGAVSGTLDYEYFSSESHSHHSHHSDHEHGVNINFPHGHDNQYGVTNQILPVENMIEQSFLIGTNAKLLTLRVFENYEDITSMVKIYHYFSPRSVIIRSEIPINGFIEINKIT